MSIKRKELEAQLNSHERTRITKRNEVILEFKRMLEEENYVLTEEEFNELMKYSELRPKKPTRELFTYIDGFRAGIEKSLSRKEIEMSKTVDAMSRLYKEQYEYTQTQAKCVQELKGILMKLKTSGKETSDIIPMSTPTDPYSAAKRALDNAGNVPFPKKPVFTPKEKPQIPTNYSDDLPAEQKLSYFMNALRVGRNNLESYGDFKNTADLFLKVCEESYNEHWNESGTLIKKASDARSDIFTMMMEQQKKMIPPSGK